MNHRLESLFIALALLLAACGKNEKPIPEGTPAPESASTIQIDSGLDEAMPSLDDVARQAAALTVAGLTFDLPPGWIAEQPSSMMRLAQYRLPGEAGAAELSVFAFGPGQGGDVQSNIDRWVAQFEPSATEAVSEVQSFDTENLKVWMVKARGNYTPAAMGPMVSTEAPKARQALFGLIVEGAPQGSVFVKVIGPEETLRAQDDNLQAFAKSVRPGS
jgi:hypothetical protein